MANEYRAEFDLKLRNRTITLRGSHEGIRAIEAKAQAGIMLLAARAMSLRFDDIFAIIYGGLVGSGVKPSEIDEAKLSEEIAELGFKNACNESLKFLMMVMNGPAVEAEPISPKKKDKRQGVGKSSTPVSV